MENTNDNEKYELDEMEQLYQMFQKVCKLFQSDFVKYSGIATVGVTIALWIIRSLGYCYQLGKFAVYGIDKCYVDVMSGNFILNIVQTVAVCIVFFAINYVYFKLSIPTGGCKLQLRRRIKKLGFCVGEIVILLGCVMFSEGISPIDLWKDLKSTSIAQNISFGIIILLIWVMINLLGMQANWFRKEAVRKEKKKNSKVHEQSVQKLDEGTGVENKEKQKGKNKKEKKQKKKEREEHKKYRKWFTMLRAGLICFSLELALMYGMGRYEENCRVEYKVVVEDAEIEQSSKYVFVNKKDDSAHMLYPVVYENQDIYILTRLYKNEDEIEIDYSYQRIINKENIEVQQLNDIKYIEFE